MDENLKEVLLDAYFDRGYQKWAFDYRVRKDDHLVRRLVEERLVLVNGGGVLFLTEKAIELRKEFFSVFV